MRFYGIAAATAALSIALVGCQTGGPSGGPPVVQARGIEGQWVDPNGIVSSFTNGVFETRTSDTNEKLAEGTYRYQSGQLVAIDLRSLVRGTTSQVNCALVTQSQLNCTSSAGAQFSLTRRA